MRVVIPDEIKSLTYVFTPYLIRNNEGTALALRDDAPKEAIVAYRKYQEWWEKNKKR